MKRFTGLILAIFLFSSATAQDPTLHQSTSPGIAYSSICYAGTGTLYIAGDSGSLLKSVNGGKNFFKLPSPVGGNIHSVSFHSPDTGYLCGNSNLILGTHDGGGQWIDKSTFWLTTVASVFAMGPNAVYAVGIRTGCLPPGGTNPCGEIMKSPDGGSTWDLEFYGTLNMINSVYFPSADTGYAVGDNTSFFVYSGSGWSSLGFTPATTLSSVHSPHAGTAYATGYDGSVWKTTDNGITWNNIPTGLPSGSLRSVWFTSDSIGYISGNSGRIMKTTDGGATWSALNTGTTEWLLSLVFSTPDTGFAVGTHETILRTTDAGVTWNSVSLETGKEKNYSGSLRIVPTPAKDFVSLVFPEKFSEGIVTVYSVSGTIMLRQNVTAGNTRLAVSRWAKGVYFVKFMNRETVLSGKIIKD
jgi:photosystem II stability/assembly factor-like uncharacterized protein